MFKNAVIITIIFSIQMSEVRASAFGEENVLLFELVTTTASQLNELEKLVSNAEKYSKQMQKYNELVQDEYFRAERVLYLSESLAAKNEIQNLGEVNESISDLKYSMADFRETMKEYSLIKGDEKKTKSTVKVQTRFNDRKEKVAKSQVNKSINAKNTGRATQITAQNTALILESNVGMHNTQLEILQKVSTTNRLLAEQLEEKRKDDMALSKSYGLKEKK